MEIELNIYLALFLCFLVVGCSSTKPIHYSGAELSARGASEYCDDNTAATARAKRDALLNAISWRYERYSSETRLGLEPTDSIEALDTYAQALRDITKQEGFPTEIEWPEVPA